MKFVVVQNKPKVSRVTRKNTFQITPVNLKYHSHFVPLDLDSYRL